METQLRKIKTKNSLHIFESEFLVLVLVSIF